MRSLALIPVALALALLAVHASRAEVVLSRLDASSATTHHDEMVAAADAPLCQATALAAADSAALSTLAACALPADASVDVAGVTYLGESGLAPDWRRRELATDERRLVTACLLAHLSGPQVAVVISMRGPELSTDSGERTSFTVEEGAFFGDVLSPGAPQALACRGTTGGAARDRTCAEPGATPGLTRCGLTYAGPCADACERRAGRYTRCRWPLGHTSAVVTVFLQP